METGFDARQQATSGEVAVDLTEVYDAAKAIHVHYAELLKTLSERVKGLEIQHVPLKERKRAEEKIRDQYEPQVEAYLLTSQVDAGFQVDVKLTGLHQLDPSG